MTKDALEIKLSELKSKSYNNLFPTILKLVSNAEEIHEKISQLLIENYPPPTEEFEDVGFQFAITKQFTFNNLYSLQDVLHYDNLEIIIQQMQKGTFTITNENLPYIIKYQNKQYIIDGNHRIAAFIFLGKTSIKGKFLDLDEKIKSKIQPENSRALKSSGPTLTDIQKIISDLGYNEFKPGKTKNELGIIVPANLVAKAVKEIQEKLFLFKSEIIPPNQIKIKTINPTSKIKYDLFLRVRRKKDQPANITHGINNEKDFIAAVSGYIRDSISLDETHKIDINFQVDGVTKFAIKNATGIIHVGKETQKKNESGERIRNKADVHIITNKGNIPLSVKEDTSGFWESVDVFWGKQAMKLIKWMFKQKQSQLRKQVEIKNDKTLHYWTLTKTFALRATPQEVLSVCFGDDIINHHGAIIKKNFILADFDWDEDNENTLNINCTYVIQRLYEIPEDLYPYIWISNDKTRKVKAIGIRGLRPHAACKFKVMPPSGVIILGPNARHEVENERLTMRFIQHPETIFKDTEKES